MKRADNSMRIKPPASMQGLRTRAGDGPLGVLFNKEMM